MSNELVTHEQQGQAPALFNRQTALASPNTNTGAVAIEQERAIAEAQGQLILAKKFPRNLNAAHQELLEACSVKAFAEAAFYSVPRGGSKVTGPSVRFAEEVARCYGNFQYGHRELSRGDGKSEVEVYAWDMEKNNYSKRQITVMHVLDTRDGPRKLRDQKDIDDKIANVASKQVRGRMLALVPKWLVAEGLDRCKLTIAGGGEEPVSVRVRKMTQAFAKFGVTVDHLEKYLGHQLDETTLDELVDLIGIFNAIKEGAKPSEYFSNKEAEAEASATTANKLADAAKAGAASAPKRTRREPATAAAQQAEGEAQQQGEAPLQNNAQSTQATPESKSAENQSTSAEEPASNVTNSPTASSSDSSRANADQEGPLF